MHFLIGVINIIFERNIIEQVVLEKKNNFTADDTKVKHTNITTIYYDNKNGQCIQK
jgi:hypothetical protein